MNWRALVGGLLPIAAYTIIEYQFGIFWGLIAGIVLGGFEIIYEWRTQGRVEAITWGANALIIGLGLVSLATQDGLAFKLQPAILEAAMAALLAGSLFAKKPFLAVMMEKQGAQIRPELKPHIDRALRGLTARMALFLGLQAGVATWAAFYWSTAAWAMLKGVGFTVSLVVYLLVETLVLRYRISNLKAG